MQLLPQLRGALLSERKSKSSQREDMATIRIFPNEEIELVEFDAWNLFTFFCFLYFSRAILDVEKNRHEDAFLGLLT